PPWAWTAYALWEPQFYDARAHYFDARFAFEPSPALPAGAPRADWPGWRTAVSTLTGVPLADLAPGPVWPTAGWIALAVLLLRLARRPDPVAREVAAWLALLALWSAAHALFFPFYFFPARRFYLVAAHVATLLAAAGAGLLLAARGRGAKAAGALLALGIALPTLAAYRAYVRSPDARPVPVRAELEPRFRAWRALAPEARRATVFPLDPLQAQAFGWLDRATAESIGEWGELPATLHVRRLERLDEKRREPSAPLPGRDRAPRQ
ncbi:MAG TPA: hypothetical protein VI942_11495, partial [Thermoanaerobaculia bacterium]|nr:hypothetical protein [Thermoanaerobaculia bacterium]